MIRTQTRIFGGDVFPTAWIHARRKLLSFWKQTWKLTWLLHSKATQWAIFLGKTQENPKYEITKQMLRQCKMPCAPIKMIEAEKWRKGEKHESWMHIRKLRHYGLFFLFFFVLRFRWLICFFSVSCCFPFSTNVNTPIPIQNKINWRRQGPFWLSPVISVLWFFHEL